MLGRWLLSPHMNSWDKQERGVAQAGLLPAHHPQKLRALSHMLTESGPRPQNKGPAPTSIGLKVTEQGAWPHTETPGSWLHPQPLSGLPHYSAVSGFRTLLSDSHISWEKLSNTTVFLVDVSCFLGFEHLKKSCPSLQQHFFELRGFLPSSALPLEFYDSAPLPGKCVGRTRLPCALFPCETQPC